MKEETFLVAQNLVAVFHWSFVTLRLEMLKVAPLLAFCSSTP